MRHTLTLCTVILTLACWLGAPGLQAQSSEQAQFDYSQYTYTWERDGVTHTSRITDVATDPAQILALTRYVYENTEIPGTYHLPKAMDAAGNYTEYHDAKYAFVPDGMTDFIWQFNYSQLPSSDCIPQREGTTAFLVKLKPCDPIVPTTYDQILDKLESVELITKMQRMEGGDNPGTLLNIQGDLDKFFVMTKGNTRTYNGGMAPFYRMYEEVSNVDSPYAASNRGMYVKMTAGQQFSSTHFCYSCIGKGHEMAMQDFTFNPQRPSVHANLFLYLPDRRLCPPDYGPEGTGAFYNLQHKPYFFMYFIGLESPVFVQPESWATDHQVPVTLTWRSSLKDVTRDTDSEEEFRLMRSVDGGKTWQDVDPSLVTVSQAGTSFNTEEDNLFRRSLDGTVTMTLMETQTAEDQEIQYKVRGRLSHSPFEPVYSEVRPIEILGYETYTDPAIRIALTHASAYAAGVNHYTNTVEMLQPTPVPMVRGHLTGATALRLVRYVDAVDASAGTEVATLNITPGTEANAEGWLAHQVTGTMNDGQPITATWWSRAGDANALVRHSASDTDDSPLLTIVDALDRATDTEADNSAYIYRLYATGLNVTTDQGSIRSNTVRASVATNMLQPQVTAYTAAQISGDTDHSLAVSTALMAISVHPDAQIERSDIYDGTDLVGRLVHYPESGKYQLLTVETDPSDPFTVKGQTADQEVTATFTPSPGLIGRTLEMVTVTRDGNAYGAPVATIPLVDSVMVSRDPDSAPSWVASELPGMVYDASGKVLTMYTQWQQLPGRGWDTLLDAAPTLGFRAWTGQTGMMYDGVSEPAVGEATVDANGVLHHVQNFAVTQGAQSVRGRSAAAAGAYVVRYQVRNYPHNPLAGPQEDSYLVTQGLEQWAVRPDGTLTALDALDVDGQNESQAVYYNLQGQLVTAPVQGTVYIRVTLTGARKVAY